MTLYWIKRQSLDKTEAKIREAWCQRWDLTDLQLEQHKQLVTWKQPMSQVHTSEFNCTDRAGLQLTTHTSSCICPGLTLSFTLFVQWDRRTERGVCLPCEKKRQCIRVPITQPVAVMNTYMEISPRWGLIVWLDVLQVDRCTISPCT